MPRYKLWKLQKFDKAKAQELAAQIKMKEADIAAETADRMRQLAAATGESAGQAEAAAGDYDRLAGSGELSADALRTLESWHAQALTGAREERRP